MPDSPDSPDLPSRETTPIHRYTAGSGITLIIQRKIRGILGAYLTESEPVVYHNLCQAFFSIQDKSRKQEAIYKRRCTSLENQLTAALAKLDLVHVPILPNVALPKLGTPCPKCGKGLLERFRRLGLRCTRHHSRGARCDYVISPPDPLAMSTRYTSGKYTSSSSTNSER